MAEDTRTETTTSDALRIKYVAWKAAKAKLESEREAYAEWLARQDRHKKYQAQARVWKRQITILEKGMDECASLGETFDFAVDLEPHLEPQETSPQTQNQPARNRHRASMPRRSDDPFDGRRLGETDIRRGK